jgi:hypothetical protein
MARSRETDAARKRPGRLRAFLATRTGRLSKRALLASLALLALSLVVRQARAAVLRLPAYRIGAGDVVFLDLPAVADDRMRVALRAHLASLLPVDPRSPAAARRAPSTFDGDVERTLRDALARHPMLRAVGELEVRFPTQVRVRATLRTPLAILRAPVVGAAPGALFDVPVDADGVVLDPSAYAGFLAKHPPIVVTGLRTACPGAGRRWLDRDDQVAEALAAARAANRMNASLPSLGFPRIAQADVSNFTAAGTRRGPGEVRFVLQDGRTVLWGRTERDVATVVGEEGFDSKWRTLLALLETRPPGEPAPLDVRFPLRRDGR